MGWHRAVREFSEIKPHGGKLEDRFIHADEAETSLGLEMFPEMVEMKHTEATAPMPSFNYLPDGHFDKSVEDQLRPNTYSTTAGHIPLELVATPEAVVGRANIAEAGRTIRAVVAICEYMDLLCDHILQTWPAGTVPDPEATSFRTRKEMEPYLKEPGSKGWKSVYSLPKIGPY